MSPTRLARAIRFRACARSRRRETPGPLEGSHSPARAPHQSSSLPKRYSAQSTVLAIRNLATVLLRLLVNTTLCIVAQTAQGREIFRRSSADESGWRNAVSS